MPPTNAPPVPHRPLAAPERRESHARPILLQWPVVIQNRPPVDDGYGRPAGRPSLCRQPDATIAAELRATPLGSRKGSLWKSQLRAADRPRVVEDRPLAALPHSGCRTL